MNTLYERSILGTIESKELFGEHERASILKSDYFSKKEKEQRPNENVTSRNQIYEGTIVAAGWDDSDQVNQLSLYTEDDEDILIVQERGIKKFNNFLNQKVKVWGDTIVNNQSERKILVKKIKKMLVGFSHPMRVKINKFEIL